MCGRFFCDETSREDYQARRNIILAKVIPEMLAAYNVAPAYKAPIIRQQEEGEQPESTMAMWRLLPCRWKKPPEERKFPTLNAKGEEAAGPRFAPPGRIVPVPCRRAAAMGGRE